MQNIFDISCDYKERYAPDYTRLHLIACLNSSKESNRGSEHEYEAAKKYCEVLCPATFKAVPFPKAPEERFKYLQFLHYMITQNRVCKKYGFSLSKFLKNPSERYLSVYTDMIDEIRRKVSNIIRTATDGPDTTARGPLYLNKGRYDDSIHSIQQLTDLISATLSRAYNYGDDTLRIFKYRSCLFLKAMTFLTNQKYPKAPFENPWDELYAQLNYIRCTYWEQNLLSTYEETQKLALKPLPRGHKYFAMRQEEHRLLTSEDNCLLFLNSKTGKIEEIQENSNHTIDITHNDDPYAVTNIDSYVNALAKYIEDNREEITIKIFCSSKTTELEENRVLNRISEVCEYLKIELQRYGRSCGFTKAKLISAYQVYFLSLPKSDYAPTKNGTPKATSPSGLSREKNTISASYQNSSEKEPLYLQLICIWTDYQFIWNTYGPFFAQKYLEINISALKAMLAVDYQSGMPNLQLHAEKVLFASMDTLIPDEDGRQELLECFSILLLRCKLRVKLCSPLRRSLILFGKFYKLFGGQRIIDLIMKEMKAEKQKSVYDVVLTEATDNSILLCTPILRILYNETEHTYEIHEFIFRKSKGINSGNSA